MPISIPIVKAIDEIKICIINLLKGLKCKRSSKNPIEKNNILNKKNIAWLKLLIASISKPKVYLIKKIEIK